MSHRHDRLELLDRYLRIPTISRQVTAEMVDAVRAFWRDVGVELVPLDADDGRGTPALFGELPGPTGAPTLLLYGHYDVQPTGDLSQRVDPQALDEEALDDVVVVARGGADNKGQHLANALGALDAARAGTAQWTVKIILDGEEEHGSPNLTAIAQAHRARLAAHVLIGSDGPKHKNRPTLVMGVRGLLGVDIVADNGQPASVHSGNYGNIVPNPVLPLARLIEDIEARVRDYAARHDRFHREATEVFAKWKDKAVWRPYLWPTVNVNHLMTDGASADFRRTIIPRSVHARLDIRLTPDTPLLAMVEIVERTAADHRTKNRGITFTVRTSGQPANAPAARLHRRPRHPGALDPGGEQRKPAARHQRALRPAPLLPAGRALRHDRLLAAQLTSSKGASTAPSEPPPERGCAGKARARAAVTQTPS